MVNEQLANLMREARSKKGLTQKEVATALAKADKDIKHNSISNWETAKTTPNIEQFVKYCQICDADFAEMLIKVYGDPEKVQDFKCTPEEAEMIRRYRYVDRRGKRTITRAIDAEYEDAKASFGEDLENATGHG